MKKKIIFGVFIIIGVLLLSGCGNKQSENNNTSTTQQGSNNKKLSCTIEVKDKKATTSNKLVFNYVDNKVNRCNVESSIKYSSKADTKSINKIKDECTKSIKNKGVTCSSNSTKDSVSVSYIFTIDKIDETGKSISYYKNIEEYLNLSYDELRSTLEEANYLCN